MTQPEFVPVNTKDEVRRSLGLPAPHRWWAKRSGDQHHPGKRLGLGFGTPGPDQGYGAKLVKLFEPDLILKEGEHLQDVNAGALAIGLKRASLFGRSPIKADFEIAFLLWMYLMNAPDEAVKKRKPIFSGAAHSYQIRRNIADLVDDCFLSLTPQEVKDRSIQSNSLFFLK